MLIQPSRLPLSLAQGWNMALKNAKLQFPSSAKEVDALIKQRIGGSLKVMGAIPYCLVVQQWPCAEPVKLLF
jgi:hypothetical protein